MGDEGSLGEGVLVTVRHLARVRLGARVALAEFEGDRARVLSGASVLDPGRATGEVLEAAGLELLPPVEPSKVVAVALNYKAHAAEMKKPLPEEPLFFLKPPSSLLAPGRPIRLPPQSREVHHEAEMGLVVGRPLCRASPDEARGAILGLVCVNDVTARDIQRRTGHYSVSKTFDTFCPMGPSVAVGRNPEDLRVVARVNGQVRQDGRTSDLIFDCARLLCAISSVMTLQPGDVVSTGTPPGVGPLHAGDVVEIEVEGVGVLSNPVA